MVFLLHSIFCQLNLIYNKISSKLFLPLSLMKPINFLNDDYLSCKKFFKLFLDEHSLRKMMKYSITTFYFYLLPPKYFHNI